MLLVSLQLDNGTTEPLVSDIIIKKRDTIIKLHLSLHFITCVTKTQGRGFEYLNLKNIYTHMISECEYNMITINEINKVIMTMNNKYKKRKNSMVLNNTTCRLSVKEWKVGLVTVT